MRVLAGEAVGELVHVREAHEDRPGILQPGDRRRIPLGGRAVGADRRSRAGRAPGDVEQILGREGPAGERGRRCAIPVEAPRPGRRVRMEDVGKGVDPRVLAPDPLERIRDRGFPPAPSRPVDRRRVGRTGLLEPFDPFEQRNEMGEIGDYPRPQRGVDPDPEHGGGVIDERLRVLLHDQPFRTIGGNLHEPGTA